MVVDGLGEFNGLDYVTAAAAADGRTMVAYMPSPRTITIDLTKLTGRQGRIQWFNPRNGESYSAGEFSLSGKKPFTPPAEGDWLLIVRTSDRSVKCGRMRAPDGAGDGNRTRLARFAANLLAFRQYSLL